MTNITHTATFVLLGRTNVGKSTLLNQLLDQQIAITSHKSHTTRNRILGVLTQDNYQMLFLDTPGLGQKTQNPIQRLMMKTTQDCVMEADAFLFMIDSPQLNEMDKKLLQNLKSHHKPILLLVNKIDTLDADGINQILESSVEDVQAIVPLSARKNMNLDVLIAQLRMCCKESSAKYKEDFSTDQSKEVMMAEIVREQILVFCHKEVPHELKVDIEQYVVEEKVDHIHVLITVKNNGQKKILIGKQGSHLKKIGQNARLKIESVFNKKIMMKIWIKVDPDWMDIGISE